jgi:O-antigen/teichoic acid export membrane protein
MSLSTRIVRSSALNVVDLIVRMTLMFFMTPFMVGHLGMNGFGTWVLLTTAILFLDLIDGGVTVSGTRFLARTIGQADATAYAETAGTLAWLYHRMGWLCLAGTAGIVLSASLLVSDAGIAEARQVLAVLGCSMALRFFLRIHLVVLKSHVRYDLIVFSGLAKLAVQSALIVALLLRGHGLVMLAVAQIASDVLDQVLVVLFSRKTGGVRFTASLPSKPLLKEVLAYSGTYFFATLGQYFRSRSDPLVLSYAVGVAAVPIYNMGMRLLTLFCDLVNAVVGGPVLAGFCQVEGGSGMDALRQKFIQAMRISVPLVTFGCVGLFTYGPSFIARWLGPAFVDSGTVLRLLVVPFALWLMQAPATSLLLTLNKHHAYMQAVFFSGLFNLAASVTMALWIGFFGVVISTMIEMSLFYGLFVPWLIARVSGIPLRSYYCEVLGLPMVAMAIPLVLFAVAAAGSLQADYLRLSLLGVGMTAVACISFWWLILRGEDKAELTRFWRQRQASSR